MEVPATEERGTTRMVIVIVVVMLGMVGPIRLGWRRRRRRIAVAEILLVTHRTWGWRIRVA